MARSRPGDDRGHEPGEDRETVRRSSDDGLPLAASVSARARRRQASKLSGLVEADETFILESFKGRWSDLPRKARKRGGTARHPGPYQDNIPVLVARDRKGATFDAVLPQDDNASIAAMLAGVVTPANHLVGDGGKPLAAFAHQAAFPSTLCPRRENRPWRRPICTSTTSTPTTAASSNGSIASTASPPRTRQATSAGGAPSKPGETKSIRQNGSSARSETVHINS